MQTYKDDELEELRSKTKAFKNEIFETIADQFSIEPYETKTIEKDGKISGQNVVNEIGLKVSKVNRKAAQCLNPRIFKLKWFSCSLILDDKRNYRPIYKFWIDSKLI